jgi:hypothetical protein
MPRQVGQLEVSEVHRKRLAPEGDTLDACDVPIIHIHDEVHINFGIDSAHHPAPPKGHPIGEQLGGSCPPEAGNETHGTAFSIRNLDASSFEYPLHGAESIIS